MAEILRMGAAIVFTLCAAGAAWLVFTRDVDWPVRNREARLRGHAAEGGGDYVLARSWYEAALASHPYDWDTRLQLANLLNYRLFDREGALVQYLYALAYSPDPSIAAETEAKVRVIRLLRGGELEDPADALEDIFVAAETGAEDLFLSRFAEEATGTEGNDLWEAWRGRGRGRVQFSRVESGRDGVYVALLEVEYPGGEAAPVRMRCRVRELWKTVSN